MKSAERRAAIVQSAIHLFAKKGFRGATTRELAAALGVTEPVLYQHFRAKRDLYAAIIEIKAEEASAHAAELVQLARGADDEAFFSALGKLILERYENDPEMFRLLFFSCLEGHDLSELFFEKLLLDFYKLVAGYIRRRIRAGAFRRVRPEIAARGLIGMLSYHGEVRLFFPDRFRRRDTERVVRDMVAVFLSGIRAPGQVDRRISADEITGTGRR